MKKIIIAFDVDGTLISNNYEPNDIIPNERIVELLKTLSSFKNIKIIVWSGRGSFWASLVCGELGIKDYVSGYYSKNHVGKDENGHIFEPDIIPDICIDDIQDCELGKINLICREK